MTLGILNDHKYCAKQHIGMYILIYTTTIGAQRFIVFQFQFLCFNYQFM